MNKLISVEHREFPRLPLDGNLDLTYRCNNNCRHCWLWLPENAPQGAGELSFEEIRVLVDEARSLGCQAWAISGGEPMLRPDFPEIFDYITRKSLHYSLNTNGTLITPQIARLMTRKGRKMVALYGATPEVHDFVTRSPGSFEATMRGFAYLREAGAGFIVQVVPMRASYHQYPRMVELAQSLSPYYRVGAPWLWLSACGSPSRNRQIADQRLDPEVVVALDPPDPFKDLSKLIPGDSKASTITACGFTQGDDRIFASCIAGRRDFHVDPYGGMSFCYYIKDPALRYDLRQGSFREAWEHFIPSLSGLVRADQEYHENCGSCELRPDCNWCPVYAYLEHGRYTAKIDYLCRVAEHTRRYKEEWKLEHLRYYQIAGITIQLTADFPFTDHTFAANLAQFRVAGPGEDMVSIRLFSEVPPRSELHLGQEVYRQVPWAVYRQPTSWVYLGLSPFEEHPEPRMVAVFSPDHSQGSIFFNRAEREASNLRSLTTFPSDQVLLARLLADRQGCYLHASGISMDGKGLLFVGHSGAGKSTILKMLREYGEILCDDRIILRRWPDGFHIHGTWSHGELPDVSPAGAPLQAIFYLEQAHANELILIGDKKQRMGNVLSYVIKPLTTPDWWQKTLDLAGVVAAEVPAYRLRFDESGGIVNQIKKLLA